MDELRDLVNNTISTALFLLVLLLSLFDCRFVKLHGGWQVRCESSTALSFSLNYFRLLENTPQFANNAWQNNTHAHIFPQLAKLFKGYENKTSQNNGFANTVPPPSLFSFPL